ncbi:MAG TPA: 16S rRNA (adenine(1518)-N(6)/adenine(1519)-N(6))-dimethyltransferase RsmA [Thermoanaerobaculia bacterium]|nr:16S rRNA (adenine(1518)-N(6)/adenine(1519)-N(6))-dimethyltransferase RsmA [Thermoanaerobaculia bacterium]HUM29496.1 16S rRNA (adenine(1518)-N(6)/adenine(1519)-N(6))-dimethyltransferase RsmA [Thermoanaerobaculia bacterium]HXK67879.1 16S rRNA (adenine(1518)-N(6)/adenine(1519)-N(6))-dimethyltransferase RsmA [Thermoanaerobaculia bacterium]
MGQHFLSSQGLARRFIDLLELQPGDSILEIGPGGGALTRHLSARGVPVVAIERDPGLVEEASLPGVEVIAGDAMEVPEDIHAFLVHRKITAILGNLPYYVATAILQRYLPHLCHVRCAVFAFQKEVADRICASPGTRPYGSLSVLCQTYARVCRALILPPGAFHPPPKVDSAVVVFSGIPDVPYPYEKFASFLYRCFAHPRKTLGNNLKGFDLASSGIDPACRPGMVSPGHYQRLFVKAEVHS